MEEQGEIKSSPEELPSWEVTQHASPLEGLMVNSTLNGRFNSESFVKGLEEGKEPVFEPLTPLYLVDNPDKYEELAQIRMNQKYLTKGDPFIFGLSMVDLSLDEGIRARILLGEPRQRKWEVELLKEDRLIHDYDIASRLRIEGPLAKVLDYIKEKQNDGSLRLRIAYNPEKLKSSQS